jgi:hypothetical protein
MCKEILRVTHGIHKMTREEFAVEKSTAYPRGFDPAILDEHCSLELASWRCAVVHHHFNSDGTHRGLSGQMENRKYLESAFDALKIAYHASLEVVLPCAA